MIDYAIHDQTGRIVQTGRAPDFMLDLQATAGTLVQGVANIDADFVQQGQITPRPRQNTELAGHVLIGQPVPCVIYINGTPYACDEPVAELELTHPSTYQIRVEAWPYVDANFSLTTP